MIGFLIFIIIQLINVVLGTVKYICTVKSTPFIAALTNALSYTVNAVLTIVLVQQELWAAIAVTFICNMVGVPIGRYVVDKFTKDRLWVYTASVPLTFNEALLVKDELVGKYNINCFFQEVVLDQIYAFTIYSTNKEESRLIVEKLSELNAKYHIVEAI